MTWKIDPGSLCATDGCTRPKATGEPVCSPCSRLFRAVGRAESAPDAQPINARPPEPLPGFGGPVEGERQPPRCIAYLSRTGDVITLELTGDPKFTERDVEAVVAALSRRRRAA